ncbi:MAG: phytanoyl-CoA dioxygenase family protein [Actinomycetota bacterium]
MIDDLDMCNGTDALETWQHDGFVRLPFVLDPGTLGGLRDLADDIAAGDPRFDGVDPVLVHHEQTVHGVAVTRAENLVPNHDGFRAMATAGAVVEAVGQLFDEPALLYKEKVNFKQPGGAGFAPHQDATAYKFADDHVTVMVAIDEATTANGCLEMVAGHHHDLLPTDGDGCIDPTAADSLPWRPVELAPGELLAFTSRTPHRSAPNTSDQPRRALFLTYNRASAGDHRAAYYADKRRHLAEHAGSATQRVSTIGHFLGTAPL